MWQLLLSFACAVLGLYGVVGGLRTGSSSDFGGIKVKRSENPISYWISIVINGVVGFGGLSFLVYNLLH